MSCSNNKPPLVVIVGPTGVGKTALSIELAKRLDGEIISADLRLFYRGMDIGTAKPAMSERQNIPHHLIDVADPDDTWSLAVFQAAAMTAIRTIHLKNKLPIMVGGTGQFVRAVIEGWTIPLQEPDLHMRNALTKWAEQIGGLGLHTRLAVIDPVAASIVDPRNVRRTIRALEVCLMTGRRFSEQRQKMTSPYSVLTLGLMRNRKDLYTRIDARIDSMVANGLVEEIDQLLKRGYSRTLPSFSAIGYKEIAEYLSGECSFEDAIILIKRKTRQFVRRQANWFRETDANIKWFTVENDTVDQMEQVVFAEFGRS